MKRICKSFAVLLVAAIALFSISIPASAAEAESTQHGLTASITSEKDSYKANEEIGLTFKVTNTNDFAVENVSLEAIIPDGLTLKNKDDTNINTVSLASGESLEFTLTAVKESSVITVPVGDTTTTQTDTKVAQSTHATSGKSAENTAITTGDNMPYLLVAFICLVALAVAIIAFKFKKKAIKYLSLVLCVCISVGSIAVVGIMNTLAEEATVNETTQETGQLMSFKVSKTISVDDTNYIIQSNTTYNNRNNEKAYNDFEKIQKATIDIEKKYLNNDGYVDYEDTEKLFDEIASYLQTQKDAGIVDYFTQSSSSIFVKMKSGINYMFVPEYKEYLSSGSEQRIITLEPAKSTFEYKHQKFIIDMGFLILGKENLDSDLIENAKLLGEGSEYLYSSEDSYVNEEVTTYTLLNLPSNSLIIFEGHGGYSEDTGSVLWTDEKVNKNVTYNYGEDAIVFGKDKTIGVTYKFFEKLPEDSLKNSTIYLGACSSAKDSRLANTLLSKGTEYVLGYNDTVSMRYEIGLRAFLLYGLTLKHDNGEPYTLEEAYDFALSNNGEKDSTKPYAHLEIIQNKHYGSLSANVVSSDNNAPLSEVRVDAYLKAESGTQYVDTVYTDDKGNFSMALQSGSYELRFNKDGYETATTTIKISKDVTTVLKDPIVMEKENDNNSNNQSTANLSSSIIGTWVAASGDPDFVLKFYSDGTCDIKSEDARDEAYMYYTVNGDQLTLYKFNKTDSRTFSCRIEGDTMYFDGSAIYVRSQ